MRQWLWTAVILCLQVSHASAKERYVVLQSYVAEAEAIVVCRVEEDLGDGTITVSIKETFKGSPREREIIRGDTGHCVLHGPVSRFMLPGKTYLVFLFKNNTVGRLGGILEVDDAEAVTLTYIYGFINTTFDEKTGRHTLSISEAGNQIRSLQQATGKGLFAIE